MGGLLPDQRPDPQLPPDPRVVAALRAAGCVFAEEEAALLETGAREGGDLALMLARRVTGEPLEQVLGWAEFHGLRIVVAPGVFVPRLRTELLVDLGADTARSAGGRPVVVDLCCGTGAVGLAVASVVPVDLYAADLDPDAVACARANLPPDRVFEGDLFEALPRELSGRVDVLLVNAPYVPTDDIRLMPSEARLHEHRVALDGGFDGLVLHRRVAETSPTWLAPGGALLIETSRRQASGTAAACEQAGLAVEVLEHDESTVVRAISA